MMSWISWEFVMDTAYRGAERACYLGVPSANPTAWVESGFCREPEAELTRVPRLAICRWHGCDRWAPWRLVR